MEEKAKEKNDDDDSDSKVGRGGRGRPGGPGGPGAKKPPPPPSMSKPQLQVFSDELKLCAKELRKKTKLETRMNKVAALLGKLTADEDKEEEEEEEEDGEEEGEDEGEEALALPNPPPLAATAQWQWQQLMTKLSEEAKFDDPGAENSLCGIILRRCSSRSS